MNTEELQEVFVEHIRDIYDAEKQLVKALPKLAKAAESEELAEGLRNHLEQTQSQVSRLEEVFSQIGVPAKGKPCKGMKGLIEEGNEAVQDEEKGPRRDIAIIAAAQKVEHYEISAYGTARTMAEHMGLDDAVELLQQTEEEEKEADVNLTKAAMMLYESAGEEEDGEGEEASGSESSSRRSSSNGGRASSNGGSSKAGGRNSGKTGRGSSKRAGGRKSSR